MHLISSDFLSSYLADTSIDWPRVEGALSGNTGATPEDFTYYLTASSLYSSKIEGNTLDADSFFRFRGIESSPKKKEVQEIEDLLAAYRFASDHELTLSNILQSHALLASTLLPQNLCGRVRRDQVGVRDSQTMKPVYLAVEPEHVEQELSRLFDDINSLLSRQLTIQEAFYYASMTHLWLAMIHPFLDGNGRCARLVEKWFLARCLGPAAWALQSERYYWDHRPEYYDNIALGFNYYALHWERCLPFLRMLPKSVV